MDMKKTGIWCCSIALAVAASSAVATSDGARLRSVNGNSQIARGAGVGARMTGSCLAIPDNAYNGTPESMVCTTQAGLPQTLQSVKLRLGVQHSFLGDLTVKVITPSNRVITVMSRPGFAEAADDGSGCCGDSSGLSAASPITFSDDATTSAEAMGANQSDARVVCRDDGQCEFAPAADTAAAGSFADLIGTNGSGNWQICVGDGESLETGSLCSATLVFNGLEGDLALTANYPSGVSSSGPFALRFNVSNNGPTAQDNVIVAAALPPDAMYLSNDCGAQSNGSLMWNVGTLANGATATCTVQMQLKQRDTCPKLVATGIVSGELADAVPFNDSSTAQNGQFNLVRDAGLETSGLAGGGDWTSTSTNFGHVFCAQGRCSDNPTVNAFDGEWWGWFGGIDPSATGGAVFPEVGTLQQSLVIPSGANTLSFQVRFPWCGGAASDFLALRIDGNEVWRADATNTALCGGGYTAQSVDISAFANGSSHTLEFHGEQAGQGTLSAFFVDKVTIQAPIACTSDSIFSNGIEG